MRRSEYPIKFQCLGSITMSLETFYAHMGIKKSDIQFRDPKDRKYLDRFIRYNDKALDFLNLSAAVDDSDGSYKLTIFPKQSDNEKVVTGVIPLRSPRTGVITTDLIVAPRQEDGDIADIVDLLSEVIAPDYNTNLVLHHPTSFRAPIYFDCMNYFIAFEKAKQSNWMKFESIVKVEQVPSGSTNWTKYALHSYDPKERLRFHNRHNTLSSNHKEWRELVGLLKYAISVFDSVATPRSLRIRSDEILSKMQSYVNLYQSESFPIAFQIQTCDPIAIKSLKKQANILIQHSSKNEYAWKVDLAELWERYVQYVVQKASQEIGAMSKNNIHYQVHGHRPAYCPAYLEPDIIVQKDNALVSIDAKYKNHMLIRGNSNSKDLKSTFRHDFHQILAYSSFSALPNKNAALIYPDKEFNIRELQVNSTVSSVVNTITLVGMPFDSSKVKDCVKEIAKYLKECF